MATLQLIDKNINDYMQIAPQVERSRSKSKPKQPSPQKELSQKQKKLASEYSELTVDQIIDIGTKQRKQ
jgi:tetratricopeptide (TPR) repeat protein